jgi:site-specific recombinase XerD
VLNPKVLVNEANAGRHTRSIQAFLGHKDIPHPARYTELSPTRSKNFFPG